MDISAFGGSGSGEVGARPVGQRHGQAALLLVESLMHALLEKGVISREEFLETVEAAAEVEHELMTEDASVPADAIGSHLFPLAAVFRRELGR